MNRTIGAACLLLAAAAVAAAAGAAAAAASPADDLARCATIAAPDARLACYDTLAHRPPDPPPSAAANPRSAPAPASPAAAAQAQATGATAGSVTAAAPAASSASVAASAPSAALASVAASAAFSNDPKNFGLTPAQQHIAYAGPQSINARIESISADAVGHAFVVLDSGQTWTILADNDGRLSKGDAVVIKRAALASFLLTTASNHSYRVRRVQ